MRFFSVLALLIWSFVSDAQLLHGTVYTSDGDLLPYASVIIQGTGKGASANNNAYYSIYLTPGEYTVRCQHVGYEPQEKKVVVTENTELNFVMKIQELTMEVVEVRSGGEDPAYRIIREAIKKRKAYAGTPVPYTVDRYSKDVIKLNALPDKIFGKKVEKSQMESDGFDSLGRGIIYLSEALSKISANPPDKFKMEVLNSRVSGSDQFGFSFPVSISLYSNNVAVFLDRLNPRGFISPIADGALSYYKYKLLGTFFDGDQMVYSIQMFPKRSYEPLFNGIINIADGSWRIHSCDVYLTKESQLEMVDTLKMQQLYAPEPGEDRWSLRNQVVGVSGKILGIGLSGTFHNVYTSYDYEPAFTKNTFGKVLVAYDTAVTSKPKAWWSTIRPVPLTEEEERDYQVKDSLFTRDSIWMRSDAYIDSLKKWQGKIKWVKVLFPGLNRTHYSKTNQYSWGIEPLLLNLNYNTVEGANINFIPYWVKETKKSVVSVEPFIRYGFSNGHLNPSLSVNIRSKTVKATERYRHYSIDIAGGKRVSQFNQENPINPLSNSLSTLLWGNNFMKIYENYFATMSYGKRWENGVSLKLTALYEDRLPLENTTDFMLFKKKNKFTPNYPYDLIPAQFAQHQAVSFTATLQFQPGQRYIQLPKSKIAVGSKWPVFTVIYSKGIHDVFGSDVDYDKWKVYITGNKNLRIAGEMRYKIGAAGFLNDKSVPVQDYWHVIGNETDALAHLVNSFQLTGYYRLGNREPFFAFAHLEHHLNGLLSNKVPLLKKMNIFFVTGTNLLYAGDDKAYAEVFFGVENIMKIIRVDLVAGFEDGRKPRAGIKIGTGGLFSGAFENAKSGAGRRGGSVNISL